MSEIVSGSERDAVFVTEFLVHCVECTVSQKADNTRQNLDKLDELVRLMRRRYPQKQVVAWYITLHPLKDHQHAVRKQYHSYIKHQT